MNLIYIAAPYSAKTDIQQMQNIHEAKILAQWYWILGEAVLCPHLNTANFSGLVPEQQFLDGTMLMLSKCDMVVFHPDWINSKGCIAEEKYAKENDMKRVYLNSCDFEAIKKQIERHIRKVIS